MANKHTEDQNPWQLMSLFQLQFYNCPTCDYKNKSKQIFVNHACSTHPESISYLKEINDGSIDDISWTSNDVNETALFDFEKEPISEKDVKIKVEEIFCSNDENQNSKLEDNDLVKNHSEGSNQSKSFTKSKRNAKTKNSLYFSPSGDVKIECPFCHEKVLCHLLKIHVNDFHMNTDQDNNSIKSYCKEEINALSDSEEETQNSNLGQHFLFEDENQPQKDDNFKPDKSDEKFSCGFCSQKFTKAHLKYKHINLIHGEEKLKTNGKIYKCETCSKTFPSSILKHKHKFEEHQSGLECEFCKLSFTSRYLKKKHIAEMHEEKWKDKEKWSCEKCGQRFIENVKLKKHMKCHEDESKQEKCDLCDYVTFKFMKKAPSLFHHKKVVHEAFKPCKCLSCEKSFGTKKELDKHVASEEGHQAQDFYTCPDCNKNFKNLCLLFNHIKITHERQLDHQCDKCGKYFRAKHLLNEHIRRIHERIMAYSCEVCGKGFFKRDHLKRHMDAIHLGEVKYNCEYCGKMFPYRQSMVFHVESVHKGIRYNCEYCSNTYTQLVHLKTHIRGSHGVEYQNNNTSSIPPEQTESST